jgi:hypothetical protein
MEFIFEKKLRCSTCYRAWQIRVRKVLYGLICWTSRMPLHKLLMRGQTSCLRIQHGARDGYQPVVLLDNLFFIPPTVIFCFLLKYIFEFPHLKTANQPISGLLRSHIRCRNDSSICDLGDSYCRLRFTLSMLSRKEICWIYTIQSIAKSVSLIRNLAKLRPLDYGPLHTWLLRLEKTSESLSVLFLSRHNWRGRIL